MLFRKVKDDQTVYVALNLSEGSYSFDFGTHLTSLTDLLSGKEIAVNGGNAHIDLPPYTAMILAQEVLTDSAPEAEPKETKPASAPDRTPTELQIGRRYRHFKGGEYELMAVARHSETDEELVIYKSVNDGQVWARPKEMFTGFAGDARRFTLI